MDWINHQIVHRSVLHARSTAVHKKKREKSEMIKKHGKVLKSTFQKF